MYIKNIVLEIFKRHFKDEYVDEYSRVKEDLNLTSIDEVEIILDIEDHLNKQIDIPQLMVLNTVGDYINFVSKIYNKGNKK